MKTVPNIIVVFAIALFFAVSSLASAERLAMPAGELKQVYSVAKAISRIQPYLSDAKYLSYAHGIYQAAAEFDLNPLVLVAIIQKESSFREGLPEGAAGELGICQIRKNWLENEKFRTYFQDADEQQFETPRQAFRFAAWILADLKKSRKNGELPYWTFYNSPVKTHRMNYYVRVQRSILEMVGGDQQRQPTLVRRVNSVVDDSVASLYREPTSF